MENVATFVQRPHDVATPSDPVTGPIKTLEVVATYLLSEEGRKASLLAGGDGKATQQVTVHVPAHRLHLVSVDDRGVARLKLRPRFQLDAENRVVRIDAGPTYDAPPTLDELFRDAAHNHQLEQAYHAERQAARVKRREADQERRAVVARAFLGDPARRALAHPPPTPNRCYVDAEGARILFDVASDAPPARDVPAEAHRRFRADLRAKREENLKTRASQVALHEEKKKFAAEWIQQHGTDDQRARQAAGVLSLDESIEAMTDHAFAALSDQPRYARDGIERLQASLRDPFGKEAPVLSPSDVLVKSSDASSMTSSQWAAVQAIRARVPDATVALRIHTVIWKQDPRVSLAPTAGALVTQRFGPFTIRREFQLTA